MLISLIARVSIPGGRTLVRAGEVSRAASCNGTPTYALVCEKTLKGIAVSQQNVEYTGSNKLISSCDWLCLLPLHIP